MFTRDELHTELMPILETLYNMDEGVWFREPVDPEKEKIPDYFDVIKNPMDLGTIKSRLNEGGHYSNPWNVSLHFFRLGLWLQSTSIFMLELSEWLSGLDLVSFKMLKLLIG